MNISGKTIIKHSILAALVLLGLAVQPTISLADYVKVKGTVVNVRQGPGTTFPVLFQAEKGEEFTLVSTEGLWCLITLDQGREAWVFRKLVDILPGQRPGAQENSALEPGGGDETGSVVGKIMAFVIILLILLSSAAAVWKRRELLDFSTRKLREISGYRREQPFRYDNRKPTDDSWEL
jgi:uncharacterized protein YraI